MELAETDQAPRWEYQRRAYRVQPAYDNSHIVFEIFFECVAECARAFNKSSFAMFQSLLGREFQLIMSWSIFPAMSDQLTLHW